MVKGSKGSKKSKTAALWYIYHMMKYPLANTLVIRRTGNSLQQSCYADLMWAIDRLGVSDFWKGTINPLQITYLPTGQLILFRGMDDAQKLASITVSKGSLCWIWMEEFFQITNEEEFDKLQMSIRGILPPESGLWKQITGTFNPWSEHSWIKKRFFDTPRDDTFTDTTTYKDNEFLGPEDIERYERMYIDSPRRARIICDGEWGIAEGLIYENWEVKDFSVQELKDDPNIQFSFGLDFGFSISYNAFVAIAVDVKNRKLWVFDEFYEKGLPNVELAKAIISKGYGKEHIIADCAEPKSIYELKSGIIDKVIVGKQEIYTTYTLPNIQSAMKGKDSQLNGIQRLQAFKIFVHPRCENTIMEFSNYCYDQDKDGNWVDKPIKEFDHCLVGDTLVATDHGPVPIKDIKVGDMVWSHLGLMKVTNKIVKHDQDIWCVKMDDGTILKGTSDHPMITTSGVKYLKDISVDDELIKWSEGLADVTTQMQSMSNMTANSGIDTQNLKNVQKESIIGTTISSCTDMSGKRAMAQSQREVKSTISTEIQGTTTSQTSDSSHRWNMLKNIRTLLKGASITKNRSAKFRTNAESGTDPQKGMSGTCSMSENISGQPADIFVNNAEKNMRPKATTIDFAHPRANQSGVVTQDSITRQEFVNTVVRNSYLTNTEKQDFVLRHVSTVGVTDTKEDVYDITVESAFDFFANGILTFDCMDAMRYASEKFFIRAHGKVAEAKGQDVGKFADQGNINIRPIGHKTKRVVATR